MSAPAGVLPATGVTAAVAAAVRDLLEHLVPLVLANVVWAAAAFVGWLAAMLWAPLGVAIAIALVWPTAAVSGIASRIVRGDEVAVRDALRWPVGRSAVVLWGALSVLAAVVLVVDLGAALGRQDLLGAAWATAACWGLVALVVVACVVWPLLGDPARGSLGARRLVRLAVTITLLRTPRVVVASVVAVALLLVSVVLAAAIMTVSVSLAALLLARVVLPLADAIDPPPSD
jgi:hypothetical protein